MRSWSVTAETSKTSSPPHLYLRLNTLQRLCLPRIKVFFGQGYRRNFRLMRTKRRQHEFFVNFQFSKPAVELTVRMSSNKKRRIVERHLPPNLEIPESALYEQLLKAERHLDGMIARKKLELATAAAPPVLHRRTLRLYLCNLFSAATEDSPAAWTFRLEGRLLQETSQGRKSVKRSFLSLVRSLVIEIMDPYGEGKSQLIEWQRGQPSIIGTEGGKLASMTQQLQCDGFEVHGLVPSNVSTTLGLPVRIYMRLAATMDDTSPVDTSASWEVFRVKNELADIIGTYYGRRIDIARAVWLYCKQAALVQPAGHSSSLIIRKLKCDEDLGKILGVEEIDLAHISKLIDPFLIPPAPIVLDYTIRFDKEYTQAPHAYDVPCWIPDSLQQLSNASLSSELMKNIVKLEDEITKSVHAIRVARAKRDFMQAFANDPKGSCERWLQGQVRDFEDIFGEKYGNIEAKRRKEYYEAAWTKEAVLHYLSSRQ